MSLPTISRSKLSINWVALAAAALLSAPAFSQPTATPTLLQFSCTHTATAPCNTLTPQQVTFSGAVSSFSIVQPTYVLNGQNRTSNAFVANISPGNILNVAVDTNAISQVGNNILAAGGSYSGTLNAVVDGVTVPVSLVLNINTSGTSALTVSPTSLPLQVVFGGQTSGQIQVGAASALVYSATATTANGLNWLQVQQTTSTTPGVINVIASTALLANNQTYTGTISIAGGGGTISVPVTLLVGAGGGTGTLNINPSPVYLSAPLNSTTSGTVTVSTLTGATSYTASLGGWTGGTPWVTFGSSQTSIQGGLFGSVALPLLVNTTGLLAGQYTAILSVSTQPDGAFASATVNLTVGSGGTTGLLTLNPTAISLSAPSVNYGTLQQFLSVTAPVANTSYNLSATSSGWLTVNGSTFSSGVLNPTASFTVQANTLNLPVGSYTGQISISTFGGTTTSAVIPVTLTIGFGGGTGTGALVAPTSLTFSGQANGSSRPGPQFIAVGGSSGQYTVSATTSTGGSTWLSVDSATGFAPYWVVVSVNPTGLAAGTYTGNVAITLNGITTNVPVSLILSPGLAVVSNPSGLFTNAYPGGTAPPQNVVLSMSDGNASSLTYTASTATSWLTVTPTTGAFTGNPSLNITINAATLPTGLNTGSVTVTVPGAANSPLTIPVTVNNFGTGGGTGTGPLTFSAASLPFTGANPPAQSLYVYSNTVNTYFTATPSTTTGAQWLSVSPTSAIAPSTLTVSVNTAGLAAGTYSGTITFVANGTTTQTLPVTLTLESQVAIVAAPTTLSFEATGSTAPAAQTISLTSASGAVSWLGTPTTSSGGNWLSISPAAGAIPGNVQVTVNPAGLAAGSYAGTISFTPNTGPATSVTVNLTVKASPAVTASPASLSFTYRAGDAVPATQQIQVNAQASTTPLSWSATVTTGSSWLSVSPASGSTPGTANVNVTPGNLDPGTYNGVITVAGTNGATGSTAINVTITVTAPLPTITRVVNAASYTSGGIAPGEIIVISGTAIGPNETATGSLDSSTGRWTTTVGGVQVLVNGFLAPVLYATTSQIGAVVPYSVAGRLDAFVQVRFRGTTSNALNPAVTTTVPGVFTANASGSGPGAILNQDGSLNGPGNPAAKGSVVVIYATGEGITQNASGARPETGQVVNVSSINDLPRPLLPVSVLIDGQPCTVTYAGQAPGQIAGLFQINAIVPPAAGSGNVSVVVAVGSNSSQSGATVSVR